MTLSTINKELLIIFTEKGFDFQFDLPNSRSNYYINSPLEKHFEKYGHSPDIFLYHLGTLELDHRWPPSLYFLALLSKTFLNRLTKSEELEYSRGKSKIIPSQEDFTELLAKIPFTLGMEYIDANWISNVFSKLNKVFASEISSYSGPVTDYLTSISPEIITFGKVFFHLVENKNDHDFPFAFLATYSTGKKENSKTSHTPLQNALIEYKGQDNLLLNLLVTVRSTMEKSPFITELVESGEIFKPLKLTSEEAYVFLREVPLYESSGILCRIPNWWQQRSAGLRMNIGLGEKKPSHLGLDALLEFEPKLYLGDEAISREELENLLAESSGLSFIKGKWIEVDQEKLNATLAAYEKAVKLAGTGSLTMAEAMRLELNLKERLELKDEEIPIEVTNGQWLNEIISKLTNPPLIENLKPSPNFKASLREYQQEGVNWLNLLNTLGLGACLADDMGLGKTVQVIAILEEMRQNKNSQTLLVLPASLLGNWQKELKKFAPKIKYKIIYSGKDELNLDDPSINLYITSYGLAMRLEELQNIDWDLLILDEAQAIKNPNTKQTRAIKLLKAKAKIALTGTPIENNLGDLWSLFDFLNKGLLGSAQEFKRLSKDLHKNQEGYDKIRKVISPFILRRLKTDKSIIADLPDKIELKTYTNLSKKQIILYKELVNELEENLEKTDGIQRKGIVLASIAKAKQICNHPSQYLGQGVYPAKDSGKFESLGDISQTIAQKRERLLVFTQFREMTEPLAHFLASVFKREGLILHGQIPVKKRQELIDHFTGKEYVPFMVLSLKAGGVGLNLTAANHVIHFDRWWNPAVENQATDRAFRIGQEKNVLVHKFVTLGTIEEKIDQMIEDKTKLASEILATSDENWLTELNNDELLEFFTLKQEVE